MNQRISITYHGRNEYGYCVFSARQGTESLGQYRCAGYTVKDARYMAREHFNREASK